VTRGNGLLNRAGDTPGDPVEDYLDQLLTSLSGSPRQVRHTLAEVEAHLRDAVAEGVAAGLPEERAQEWAVARMGPVTGIAGRSTVITRPSWALVRRLILTAALVGGGGLLAVGGAGLVARLLVTLRGGGRFMTAPWPAGSYTPADCARWLAGDPHTRSCVSAMLADHTWDFLLETAAAGVLGLLTLGLYLVLRQRWRDRATVTALPPGTAQLAGAVLAALAAVACFGLVFDIETVQRGVGVGQSLSLGIAAVAAAATFGFALLKTITRRA
jgi:HAAS domain-containing protein